MTVKSLLVCVLQQELITVVLSFVLLLLLKTGMPQHAGRPETICMRQLHIMGASTSRIRTTLG